MREFADSYDVRDISRLLLALKIDNNLRQGELAERMSVSEAQVSRDERNEYHGITIERAQRMLNAMGDSLRIQVEDKPLSLA